MNQPRLSTFGAPLPFSMMMQMNNHNTNRSTLNAPNPSWLVLGQASADAMETHYADDDETNHPAAWKLHNGLLYPVVKDGTVVEAPFLASTERLIHALCCSQPSQESTAASPDSSELEDLEPFLTEKPDTNTSNMPLSSIDDDTHNVLKRIDNIADWTRNALEDIRQLRQRNYNEKEKKQHRLSSNERREMALEHQRRRLLAQMSSSQTSDDYDKRETDAMELDEDDNDDNEQRIINNDDDDNLPDENNLVFAPEEEDIDESDDNIREDPWWRLARTLNSCKILTSLLLPMFNHKNRHDKQLDIGNGVTITRKDKQCWLIICSEQVDSLLLLLPSPQRQLPHSHGYYSVTSKKILASLNRLLLEVLSLVIINPCCSNPIDGMNVAANGRKSTIDSWDNETIWKALDDSMHRLARIFETPTLQKSISLPLNVATNFNLEQIFKVVMEKATDLSEKGKNKLLDCCTLERLQEHLHIIDRQCDLTAASSFLSSSSSKQDDIHSQYLDSIHALRQHLSQILTRKFPNARLSVYGSCLSDLSTGISTDVDLSLYVKDLDSAKSSFDAGEMSVSQYQKILKTHVYQTCRALEHRRGEFVDMLPVTRARVPVVKGTWTKANNPHSADGSIDFDICFLNDIAVVNSELLRQYALVDERVKILMVTVKRLVKNLGIGTAQNNHLSSYAWMNLVIFYCQCIDLVPNLQCPKLMERAGVKRNPNNRWHNIRNLDTCYLTWKQASTVWEPPRHRNDRWSVSALLYGFLEFYASFFPATVLLISIKRGKDCILPKTVFRKSCLFWTIEDPFETYDSHCPHDLGMHANEPGALRILRCFQTAALDTRQKLVDSLLHNNGFNGYDTLAEMSQCWPFLVSDLKDGNAEKANSAKANRTNSQKSKSNETNQKAKNQEIKNKPITAKNQKNVKQQEQLRSQGTRKTSKTPTATAKVDGRDVKSIPKNDHNIQKSNTNQRTAPGNGRLRRGRDKHGMTTVPEHEIKKDVPQPSSPKGKASNNPESARETASQKDTTNPIVSTMNSAAAKPKSKRRRGKGQHNASTKPPAGES